MFFSFNISATMLNNLNSFSYVMHRWRKLHKVGCVASKVPLAMHEARLVVVIGYSILFKYSLTRKALKNGWKQAIT